MLTLCISTATNTPTTTGRRTDQASGSRVRPFLCKCCDDKVTAHLLFLNVTSEIIVHVYFALFYAILAIVITHLPTNIPPSSTKLFPSW